MITRNNSGIYMGTANTAKSCFFLKENSENLIKHEKMENKIK